MYRRILAALLAVAMTPLAGLPAAAVQGDSVRGFARLTLEHIPEARLDVSINARSGPNGENPSGTINIDRTGNGTGVDHTFSGVADVICVGVDGNQATVAGKLRRPVPNPHEPGTEYQYVAVLVADEGTPGVGADRINSFVSWGPPGEADPISCGFRLGTGGGVIVAGNLTVRDAT